MENLAELTFLKFTPVYMERVWGGDGLKTLLGRNLPGQNLIGESWEVVDRPEAQSEIAAGPLAGLTLRQALERHGEVLMGPGCDSSRPFPVLVKWLDCQQRLSLQVHPPACVADELGGEPKTENWYVAAAKPDASLIGGLKDGVNRQQFEQALHAEQLEDCIHAFDVRPGDSFLVESGRLHAIDAGNLILEIQQNSDTTYRVYDWGRVGLDGKSRQLHVEESMRCIDFADFALSFGSLGTCWRRRLEACYPAGTDARLLHVVEGAIREVGTGAVLQRGDNVLLPFAVEFEFTAEVETLILVTDRFREKNSPQ